MDWSAAAQFYEKLTHSYSSVLKNKKLVCSGPTWKHFLSLGRFYGWRSEKDQERSQSRGFQCPNFYLEESSLEKYTLIPFNCDIKIFPRAIIWLNTAVFQKSFSVYEEAFIPIQENT